MATSPRGMSMAETDDFASGFHILLFDFKLRAQRDDNYVSLSWDEADLTGQPDQLHAIELLATATHVEEMKPQRGCFMPCRTLTVPYGGMEHDPNPFRFMDPVNWRQATDIALTDQEISVAGSRAVLELSTATFHEGTNVTDAVARHTAHWPSEFNRLQLERLVSEYMNWRRSLQTRAWAAKVMSLVSQGFCPLVESLYTTVRRFGLAEFACRLELGVRNLPDAKRRGFFAVFMSARYRQTKPHKTEYEVYTDSHRRFKSDRLTASHPKWRYFDAICAVFDAIEVWRDTHLQEIRDQGREYVFKVLNRAEYRSDRPRLGPSWQNYRNGEFFYESLVTGFPAAMNMIESFPTIPLKFWRSYLTRRIFPDTPDHIAPVTKARQKLIINSIPLDVEPAAKRARVVSE